MSREHETERHAKLDADAQDKLEPATGQGQVEPPAVAEAGPSPRDASRPRHSKKLTDWLQPSGRPKPAVSGPRDLVFDLTEGQTLTPVFLATKLLPYMLAVDELQRIAELLNNEPMRGITIVSIIDSAVSINADGAHEIVRWVRDRFDDWRARHEREMVQLEEEKLANEMEAAKIEQEIQSLGLTDEARPIQAGSAEFEAALRLVEHDPARQALAQREADIALRQSAVRQAQLQNQKALLELGKEKFQLAVDFVRQVRPNVTDQELLPVVAQAKRQIDVMLDTYLRLKF